MQPWDSRLLSRAYLWGMASPLRVLGLAVVVAALLVAAALSFSPPVFGAVTAAVLFGIGIAAYRVRYSGAALDFPGIDRFFQQVPCYLSIQDRDLNIIRANRFFRRDFGEGVGHKCYSVYKGFDEACPDCPVIRTFQDGETHTKEETVVTKDGHRASMIVYTHPVRDEEGRIAGVMEMSTNITEVKRLQAEIEAKQREYQELFERVPCYLSIQDRDFRILRLNELFRTELGDRVGDYCYSVYKGRDCVCPDCHVAKTLEDGKIHGGEKTVVKPDGTEARLMVYSSPIYGDDGRITAVMEMATDITEVKKLQQELTYMGKAIAVMAHRIKNILSGLEGGIFVVNTGIEDGDDALRKKGWGMVQRNVEKVSQIVKDLLYSSKGREMNRQMIDPAPIVHSVHELFEGRARKEGIRLECDVPPNMPTGLFDADALHSLMTNLVTNAFEACLSDATEGKTEHYVIIRAACDDSGKYAFEVEDNGAGIPGQVGESVFEDFFSTKGREGTGLGLLVAQKIIEEHGGTITFSSHPGAGTTFRAIVPPAGGGDRPN